MSEPPERAEGEHFRGLDWYAEDLAAAQYVECTFSDVDLSEVSTAGALFDRWTFHNNRFNASTHRASGFVACDFRRTSFFDVTFEGCKLVGSAFTDCVMRPLKGGGRAVAGRHHPGHEPLEARPGGPRPARVRPVDGRPHGASLTDVDPS